MQWEDEKQKRRTRGPELGTKRSTKRSIRSPCSKPCPLPEGHSVCQEGKADRVDEGQVCLGFSHRDTDGPWLSRCGEWTVTEPGSGLELVQEDAYTGHAIEESRSWHARPLRGGSRRLYKEKTSGLGI